MRRSSVWGPVAVAAMLLLRCLGVDAQAPGSSTPVATTASEAGTMTVRAQALAQILPAYGQVEPIAPLSVHAIEAGVIADMKVVPGSQVKAGEALATLTGPEIQSLLVNREGAVRSAQAQLSATERTLTIERRQLSAQMSTQQTIAAARSAFAAAKAAFDTAQSDLMVAQEMRALRAPSTGTVLAVETAEGERVMAGQTVLTLQANDRLWLAAVYYGADAAAIRVGMMGKFEPASGGAPVPVKVAAVSGALAPDAGESVGLMPTHVHVPASHALAAPWLNGERGTVTLTGPTRYLVAVPTRALILDQARWWVLVRTPKGVHAQAVVPGPTRGWETFIEQGLSPGEQVVVQNAYLEYHRSIAQRYVPPD